MGPTETLHFSGRWNIQSGPRATTVNSGSYVIAQFTGTGITGKFDTSVNDSSDLPTVAWSVDGATTWSVAEVKSTLSMGSNLSSGTHTITLIARGLDENKNRWSPPLASSITFLGFDVTGGALVATPRPVQPKLEILGDSITEGVIVQGSSYMGHSGQCWKNDAVYSYPTQTGRALNADYRQVGFGYQGLLKTGDGGVPAANDSFNWFYKDVPRDTWQADMVVINQGTNDSSQPTATFKTAYSTFLTHDPQGVPEREDPGATPLQRLAGGADPGGGQRRGRFTDVLRRYDRLAGHGRLQPTACTRTFRGSGEGGHAAGRRHQEDRIAVIRRRCTTSAPLTRSWRGRRRPRSTGSRPWRAAGGWCPA